jgi:hypothetical protein
MKNTDNQIAKMLNSLDGISRAEPKPFFFTRLEARMEARMENEMGASTYAANKLKLALLAPILACSLLLSVASVYTVLNYNSQDSSLSSEQAFIQEYNLNKSVGSTIY